MGKMYTKHMDLSTNLHVARIMGLTPLSSIFYLFSDGHYHWWSISEYVKSDKIATRSYMSPPTIERGVMYIELSIFFYHLPEGCFLSVFVKHIM